jgi:hypothetical protein
MEQGQIKLYVVVMGLNFEQAKVLHGDDQHFNSVEEAVIWAQTWFEPGCRFWICDEEGNVVHIGSVPRLVGTS